MRSKALAKTLSGKKLTLIQNIVCVVLIVVMALTSFGTIFSLEVDLDSETKKSVEDFLSDMKEGDEKIDIPDEINVSLPFMIRSVGSLADVLKSAMDGLKEMNERDKNDSEREIAPAKPAEDAIMLDNSDLDLEGTADAIIAIVNEKTK